MLPVCRVDENNVRREEAFNEKKGLLDMQIVMEEHYKAKVGLLTNPNWAQKDE